MLYISINKILHPLFQNSLQTEHNKQLAEIYSKNQQEIEDVRRRHSGIVKVNCLLTRYDTNENQ